VAVVLVAAELVPVREAATEEAADSAEEAADSAEEAADSADETADEASEATELAPLEAAEAADEASDRAEDREPEAPGVLKTVEKPVVTGLPEMVATRGTVVMAEGAALPVVGALTSGVLKTVEKPVVTGLPEMVATRGTVVMAEGASLPVVEALTADAAELAADAALERMVRAEPPVALAEARRAVKRLVVCWVVVGLQEKLTTAVCLAVGDDGSGLAVTAGLVGAVTDTEAEVGLTAVADRVAGGAAKAGT
jgi:hypothetical protein